MGFVSGVCGVDRGAAAGLRTGRSARQQPPPGWHSRRRRGCRLGACAGLRCAALCCAPVLTVGRPSGARLRLCPPAGSTEAPLLCFCTFSACCSPVSVSAGRYARALACRRGPIHIPIHPGPLPIACTFPALAHLCPSLAPARCPSLSHALAHPLAQPLPCRTRWGCGLRRKTPGPPTGAP